MLHPLVAARCAVLCLCVLLAAPVLGQALEEVVVTARKRSESLQDIPLSVTAFTAEALQEMGARNNYDVANLTVNFNTQQQVGRRLDRPIIRGMPSSSVGGEPNASYFIDGVFVSGSISTATLGPIERVEILRGPQSAQFGRATFSGAVNYITRQPSNEFEGEVATQIATDEDYLVSGWVTGPLVEDKLAYFASASWDHYGGEWNNAVQEDQASPTAPFVDPPQRADGSSLGGEETFDVVGKLLWTPTDTIDIMAKLSYTNGDDEHYPSLIMEPSELNCWLPTDPSQPYYETTAGAYCGVLYPNGRENRINIPDFQDGMTSVRAANPPGDTTVDDWTALPGDPGTRRDQLRFLLEYQQDLNSWDFLARFASNDDEAEQGFDLDRTSDRPLAGNFTSYSDFHRRDWSTEVRLATPTEWRVRAQAGVYIYDRHDKTRSRSFPGLGNAQFSAWENSTIRNEAVFGAIDFDITERWTFTAEARYAEDEIGVDSPNGVSAVNTFESLTPRFTLEFQATDDAMIYVLAAKGNKPGSFNAQYFRANTIPEFSELSLSNGEALVDEEKVWTYEIGIKTSWLDGRIIANLSAFYNDWTNQGVFRNKPSLVIDPAGTEPCELDGMIISQTPCRENLTNVQENAGTSDVFGLELETTFAITDNLIYQFAYGLADAEFDEYNDGFFADSTGIDDPLLINGGNVHGFKVPNVPKHSLVTSLDYRDALNANWEWFLRTDFIWESRRYTQAANFTQTDDRSIWNWRLGVQNERWTLTGFVNNILDDTTQVANLAFVAFDTPLENGNPAEYWTLNPSRGISWGVEARYAF